MKLKELMSLEEKEELQEKLIKEGYKVSFHPDHLRIWTREEVEE